MATIPKLCKKCGKTFGGILGLAQASDEDIRQYRVSGIDIPIPICGSCLLSFKNLAEQKREDIEQAKKQAEEIDARITNLPTYTFNPFSAGSFQYVDMVSAYVVLGTGPVTAILSSWTDFFGSESNAYNKKMIEGTNACIYKLKQAAYNLDANAIIGLQTTFTELTAGHGQIMVAMIGTAVKVNQNEAIQQ